MMTRREVSSVWSSNVAISASCPAPRGLAQPLARTVHILSGFTT